MERVVHMHLYKYLFTNNLIYGRQSAYSPGDSTAYQLVSLVHFINEFFDNGQEIRTVFLDISKAFDKTWHEGLLFKLRQLGIDGSFLKWIESYLTGRSQQVVIRGKISGRLPLECGVPQGSLLGPLLFLVYVNDLQDVPTSLLLMYADDALLVEPVEDPSISALSLNSDLPMIKEWADQWLIKFNPNKCKSMIFSVKRNRTVHPPLRFNNVQLQEVSSHKHLGVTLTSNLNWSTHVNNISDSARGRLGSLRYVAHKLPRPTLEHLYIALVRPIMEHASIVWFHLCQNDSQMLEQVQFEAARLVTGAMRATSLDRLTAGLGWPLLATRIKFLSCVALYKITQGDCPNYIKDLCPKRIVANPRYHLRSGISDGTLYQTQLWRTKRAQASFFPSSIAYFNSLSSQLRSITGIPLFKKTLRTCLFPHKAPWFYSSDHSGSIYQTQMRLNMCPLNSCLHKINVKESPSCVCGAASESIVHFLLVCPLHALPRRDLLQITLPYFDRIKHLSNISLLSFLLNGCMNLNFRDNLDVFKAVGKYITITKKI